MAAGTAGSFLAKSEIAGWPLLGTGALRFANVVFVRRDSPAGRRQARLAVGKALEECGNEMYPGGPTYCQHWAERLPYACGGDFHPMTVEPTEFRNPRGGECNWVATARNTAGTLSVSGLDGLYINPLDCYGPQIYCNFMLATPYWLIGTAHITDGLTTIPVDVRCQ